MTHTFRREDLLKNKWYLVVDNHKVRPLKYNGTNGEAHFETACGISYWCPVRYVESGPYNDMERARLALSNPKIKKVKKEHC
jgi:hypothetical protein